MAELSDQLVTIGLWAEAKQFLSEQIPIFQDVNGLDDKLTLKMRWRYALVLEYEGKRTEAVAILEDVERRYRRVLGDSHPLTTKIQSVLEATRN